MSVPLINPLVPRQPVPLLDVALVGGGRWRLADRTSERFSMIVFYRGLHCPVCAGYLQDLNGKLAQFVERGVDPVAISSDTEERAQAAKEKWRLSDLHVGYGLDLNVARSWGLYLSSGRGHTSAGVDEPPLFSEPALYLIRPNRTLYFGAVQTMPFARPHFDDILKALDFVIAKDYPARGEFSDEIEAPQAAA